MYDLAGHVPMALLGSSSHVCVRSHRVLGFTQGSRTSARRGPRGVLALIPMPLAQEMRHPRSLSFANERKVMILRDVHGLPWADVAAGVVNMQGAAPGVRTVQRVHAGFSSRLGRRPLKYRLCGRRPWKCTPAVERYLIGTLLAMRRHTVCTATTLQACLVRARGVRLDASTIRKVLARHGYRWLPRSQKPAVSKDLAKERLAFARAVVRKSMAELRDEFAFSMDGVILSRPPTDAVERINYCKEGMTHMYRKRGESAHPDLAGDSPYPDQIPRHRLLPMWGGISPAGCAIVTFHKKRKMTTEEWERVVKAGKLKKAVTSLRPRRRGGPWRVLCDGESFLWSKASLKACAASKISLWRVPPKSPDLSPVEKFWGWLRRELLVKDLADLKARRAVLGPSGYKARVRAILASKRANLKAGKFAGDFRRVCKEVIRKKGARVK